LVDEIVPEPLGGAHRNVEEMALRVKKAIDDKLTELDNIAPENLIKRRQQRLLSYGEFEG
jgi:acetyl-CoA carboxylase carboxyl transferase subunit alpha